MSSADEVLVHKFAEAEARLSAVPTDVDVLLPLLDHVEVLLSKVEQSPLPPLQGAYQPTMRALLNEAFLRHPDTDVKVAVASCISEITRITAPETPYNDDEMKEVFKLIVFSFKDLADKSSRSYDRRVMILETVAKVRSCVVMLDLECDSLLVEMFQHLLSSIRDYHPENVFMSMETIMVLVVEESEDVSSELLTPLLVSVRGNDEEVSTTSRKLGERVLEKCADKVKPYLPQALKSLGFPLDSYGKVVALICEGGTAPFEVDDNKHCGEKLEVKENVTEEPEVHPEAEMSATSNGTKDTEKEGMSGIPECSEKPSETNCTCEPLGVKLTSTIVSDCSDSTGLVSSEIKPEQIGRKPDSILNSTELSDSSQVDGDKEPEITCVEESEKEVKESPRAQKSDGKDTYDSFSDDQHEDTGASSANEKGVEVKATPKVVLTEVEDVSVNPIESLPDESFPKDAEQLNKKENSNQDAASAPVPAMVAGGNSDLDSKPQGHSEEEKENLAEQDVSSLNPDSAKTDNGTSDSAVQMNKRSGMKKASMAQEEALNLDPVSENLADRISDSEIIPQKCSGKKKRNMVLEDAPCLDSVSLEVPGTIDSAVKQKRLSEKKKDNLVPENAPSGDPVLQADGTNDSDVKPPRRTGKRTARVKKENNIIPGRGGTSKTGGEMTTDSEAKALMQCAKKGEESDSEAKPRNQSGKKGQRTGTSGKPLKQSGKKGDASDSETKLLKQSGEKVDNSKGDKVSAKENNVKKRGRRKETAERESLAFRAKDDDQEMFASPKSVQDEDSSGEPKNNSKRKQATGKNKVSEHVEVGENLVGSKVKVWWPKDREYYEGVIASYDPEKKRHKVSYNDGDEEILNLSKEKWELIEGETMEEEVPEDSDPDGSAKTHKKKKAKTNSEPSPNKKNQMDVLHKRVGGAASSKSKSATTKKLKKSEENSDEDLLRTASKGKDGGMPKMTTKSQPENPKLSAMTKGKSPGNKSNGMEKEKSSSLKLKETVDKGKSSHSGRTPDAVKGKGKSMDTSAVKGKGKSTDTSETRESEGKSGKKRRRGVKG